jgi:hypothetical protein
VFGPQLGGTALELLHYKQRVLGDEAFFASAPRPSRSGGCAPVGCWSGGCAPVGCWSGGCAPVGCWSGGCAPVGCWSERSFFVAHRCAQSALYAKNLCVHHPRRHCPWYYNQVEMQNKAPSVIKTKNSTNLGIEPTIKRFRAERSAS